MADLRRHTSGWVFNLLDAPALSVWVITRAQKTLNVGLGWLPAWLLSTITAVSGCAIRELMMGRTPDIFGGNRRTSLVCATGAVVAEVVRSRHSYRQGCSGRPGSGRVRRR
ncbi:TRIC cation channel family protein [Streptomyces sp. NPDC005480]|uniref:TRIC cation channel family protein n=1 Tax=Streptomyces sp. NPDC005480 TaxID=3154880 RepID=UPI0033B01CF7